MREEAQTVVGEEWGSWDPETRITGCMMRLLRDCGIRPAGSSPSPAAASPAPRDARVSWAVPQSLAALCESRERETLDVQDALTQSSVIFQDRIRLT